MGWRRREGDGVVDVVLAWSDDDDGYHLTILLFAQKWYTVLKDRRGDQRGVNGSQSKFLTGIWPMSQNQPDVPLY
jgi:hypothetical protein